MLRIRPSACVAMAIHGAVLTALARPVVSHVNPPPILIESTDFPEEPVPNVQETGLLPGPTLEIPRIEGLQHLSPITFPGLQSAAENLIQGWLGPTAAASGPWSVDAEPLPVGLVQQPPELLSAPPPVYPAWLRDAGIEGRVVIQLVVDTLGRAEPASLRVVHSDHTGFDAPSVESLRQARFRPARVYGRAVRVLVQVPVQFRLSR